MLTWNQEGDEAVADSVLRHGDVFSIDTRPDDDGYFYLRINGEECLEGDWRKSMAAMKKVAESYEKKSLAAASAVAGVEGTGT